jgi:predicted GH43/DUF377 family glycosyl hydrolase
MIQVKKEGILIEKTNLGFENEGVLNPALIVHEGSIYMYYRAVSKGNYSSIGFCKMDEPLSIKERWDVPILFPQYDYESHGVEDPRIVKIDDLFYLTYTAYDGVNAMAALAVSTDLKHWDKKGIIVPQVIYQEFSHLAESKGPLNEKYLRFNERGQVQKKQGKKVLMWDKNVIFFPRKINGKFYFLHRIKPDIQIVAFDSLEELTLPFWQHYFLHMDTNIVIAPKFEHEVSYLGGGCPPIETSEGWLLIYHGVYDTVNGYVYNACASMLDLHDPQKEIARLPYPLFRPEEIWELRGEVNNVCFPTGTVLTGDILFIYYGAADERIAVATVSITDLVKELLLNPV